MAIFDIQTTAFSVLGYPLSYVELLGTFFGLLSVYFASQANILTWPTGIVNEIFFFLLFFQVQLYADMFLQIYFFVVTIYGWYNWKQPSVKYRIDPLNVKTKILMIVTVLVGALLAGFVFSHIHRLLPVVFSVPASYPYPDSFILVASIVATILLAKKKIETWYLWIAVDAVAVLLYLKKEIYFLSLEYAIFLGIATYGLYRWRKQQSYG